MFSESHIQDTVSSLSHIFCVSLYTRHIVFSSSSHFVFSCMQDILSSLSHNFVCPVCKIQYLIWVITLSVLYARYSVFSESHTLCFPVCKIHCLLCHKLDMSCIQDTVPNHILCMPCMQDAWSFLTHILCISCKQRYIVVSKSQLCMSCMHDTLSSLSHNFDCTVCKIHRLLWVTLYFLYARCIVLTRQNKWISTRSL